MPAPRIWLYISKTDLETERRQCLEEGKDLAPLEDEFARVAALDLEDPADQPAAQALLDASYALPIRADFPYHEPSDLAGIRAARPSRLLPSPSLRLNDAELRDRIHGAWL